MSGQAGILFDDRRPVPSETLRALSAWNDERGPHAKGQFIGNGVALLHWALHVDRLSALERQPCRLADGGVLTWDGRLDNREDLLLQLNADLKEDHTDVALVAAGLQKWATDALRRFIGDWALAWWDPAQEALTLARDFMGNRPLYYVTGQHATAYSTCLETLVALFERYERLDRAYLAHFLLFGTPVYRTPYEGIFPVPAGHFIQLRPDTTSNAVPFRKLGANTTRYQHDGDYSAHLRALFADAVRSRLRSRTPVWSELSGGLDSSAIVGLASTLARRGLVEAPEVRPISRIFLRSPESDEQIFIEAVERFCGVNSTRVEAGEPHDLETYANTLRPYSREILYKSLVPLMRACKSNVLMTGTLGDNVMAKSSRHNVGLTEHLRSGRVREFIKGCRQWARQTRKPVFGVVNDVLSVFKPFARRERAIQKQLLSSFAKAHRSTDLRLSTVFAVTERTVDEAKSIRPTYPPWLRDLAFTKRIGAMGIWLWTANEALMTSDRMPDILMTHPYTHVPLVEFVLAIPETVRWQPLRTRALMRDALGSLLPDLVLERETKGNAPPAIARTMRPLAIRFSEGNEALQLVELGLVDREGLMPLLERFIDGSMGSTAYVSRLLQMEAWLQSRRWVMSRTGDHSVRGRVAGPESIRGQRDVVNVAMS